MAETLTVWCNANFPANAVDELKLGLSHHRLLLSSARTDNLGATGADPLLEQADIAFGQPDPDQAARSQRLRWIHLTSAGYTRYDRDDFRAALKQRGAALTTSSSVYAEPCAQHILAMMLTLARRLLDAHEHQRGRRAWPTSELRIKSQLLIDQTVLIVGYGAIGRRLAELLKPFEMNIVAVRRSPRGDEAVRTFAVDRLDELLAEADHIVNVLPASAQTDGLFDASRFALVKPNAIFYNIGRGSTVDQDALRDALETGKLFAAYLDVTTPEPLSPDDPLWTTPNCYITPHTAGGHSTEFLRLVRHFLDNFREFRDAAPLFDRVM